MQRRPDEASPNYLELTKIGIASRLRRVCAHMTDDEFDGLVHRIATIEVKYALRQSEYMFSHAARAPRADPDTE